MNPNGCWRDRGCSLSYCRANSACSWFALQRTSHSRSWNVSKVLITCERSTTTIILRKHLPEHAFWRIYERYLSCITILCTYAVYFIAFLTAFDHCCFGKVMCTAGAENIYCVRPWEPDVRAVCEVGRAVLKTVLKISVVSMQRYATKIQEVVQKEVQKHKNRRMTCASWHSWLPL